MTVWIETVLTGESLYNLFSHLRYLPVLAFRVDRKNKKYKVVYDVSYCAGWIWISFYLSTKN